MIKLFRFLKPYRMILVVVLVLAFAQAMANLYLPNLMAQIVDNGIIKNDTGYIWRTGELMLLVAIGGTICAVIGIFYSSQVATGFGRIIRGKIFTHIEHFSLHEFRHRKYCLINYPYNERHHTGAASTGNHVKHDDYSPNDMYRRDHHGGRARCDPLTHLHRHRTSIDWFYRY